MDPIFDYGDLVRVSGTFMNSNGSATVDPTVVKFQYNAQALGITTTYTYGTDAALVKDSAGRYHCDIDTNESSGIIFWRIFSTSTGQAAEEGRIYVRPRQF